MKLTHIFNALAAGELSKQSALVEVPGGIRPEHYSDIISHINLGLTNLHEKFNIRVGDCYIMMQDGIGVYELNSKHAISNLTSTNYAKFIIDDPEYPFKDDVIKILEATTEIGEPLPINDRTKEKSIFTASQTSIQVPWQVHGDVINIMYRATHRQIALADYNNVSEIEVDLAASYLEPLLYFVAHRHFAGVGGQSATPTSMAYYQKYLARVQEMVDNGLDNRDNSVATDHYNSCWP